MQFSCSKCDVTGKLQMCIRHFLMSHVPVDGIPFYCTLCGFKATTLGQYNSHLKKSKIHKKLLAEEDNQQQSYLVEGRLYNVTWGKSDTDLIPVSDELDMEEVIEEEDFLVLDKEEDMQEFRVSDVGVQTDKTEEENSLEEARRQNRKLGDYIERMEKRMEEMRKELKETREECRKMERYVPSGAGDYGMREFEEAWEEEEQRNRKRVKSVVCVPGKKRKI